jgi:hypothetical protein
MEDPVATEGSQPISSLLPPPLAAAAVIAAGEGAGGGPSAEDAESQRSRKHKKSSRVSQLMRAISVVYSYPVAQSGSQSYSSPVYLSIHMLHPLYYMLEYMDACCVSSLWKADTNNLSAGSFFL